MTGTVVEETQTQGKGQAADYWWESPGGLELLRILLTYARSEAAKPEDPAADEEHKRLHRAFVAFDKTFDLAFQPLFSASPDDDRQAQLALIQEALSRVASAARDAWEGDVR